MKERVMRSVSIGDSFDFDPVDALLVDFAPATRASEVTPEQWAYLRSIPADNVLNPGGYFLLGFAEEVAP